MEAFAFAEPATLDEALTLLAEQATLPIAGGTELVNWLKEGIETPDQLVDINRLPGLDGIEAAADGLRLGALARMSGVAEHESVVRDYAAISEALLKSASPQLRNMATIGGNLLQRTRCPYFRAEVDLECNKRRPGSGCAALESGEDRGLAIFGGSERCIATHPSDVAVALVALEARVETMAVGGGRSVALADFYRLPGNAPERDTILEPGELIVAIAVPASGPARRSHYLKVRERSSYEFALVSAAVGLELDGTGAIRAARVALGGVGPKPWRLMQAETALPGVELADEAALRDALEPDFAAARPGRRNAFKVELAKRAVVRALQTVGGVA